ncbi:MAG TPA: dTDP-4-dehydrorhamnose reductase [Acidobacteriaceae bacterium]
MSDAPRILILGASGQLGIELQRSFAGTNPLVAADREIADLASPEQLRAIVRRVQPHVILNAAAYTAVDRAESEPQVAAAINERAPRILAEEARQINALFVHYSTDYVFDGSKTEPWTEDDAPHPLNAYGAGKLAGEEAVRAVGGRYLIFRTSWVYAPHGKNFLLTMLRLGRERDRLSVVDDQLGAPTTAIELARATRAIADGILAGQFGPTQDWAGLYHMTCGGSTTWCGFAQAIFARAGSSLDGRQPEVTPIPSSEYPTPAQRPRNTVLSNVRLHARFGMQLAPWQAALDEVLAVLRARA